MALLESGELTGNSLESYTLNYSSDAYSGVANHYGIVKEIRIGQSATKSLYERKAQRLSILVV